MTKRLLLVGMTILFALIAFFICLRPSGRSLPGYFVPAMAASGEVITPTLITVDPASGPNDINTTITITGTNFSAILSDTLPITPPSVYLGDSDLPDVQWVSTTTLTASVPWGLVPRVYSLRVVNPEGGSATLPDAYTVSQGLGVWVTGGPYGGRVEQILIRPDAPDTAYAVIFQVGAFATFDGGGHWEPMVRLDNPTRLAFDAQDPDVIYTGGSGLQADNLRSMDGGHTWTLYFDEFFPVVGAYMSYPVPHPTQAGVIYLATGSAETMPYGPGEGGVYYSANYGETWEKRNTGLTDTDLVDLAFHPQNPAIMAAAARQGKIFITSDGGLHWQEAFDLGRNLRRIYFNPYGSHEAWVVPHTEYQPPQTVLLFKSKNNELTAWDTLQLTAEKSPSGAIWTLAFKPGAIWAGGDRGYISDDGGAIWDAVMDNNDGINQIKTFAFTPGDDQTIYAGIAVLGVVKSLNGGATWLEKNEGLAGLQVRSLAVARGEIDTIYAYTYERGILRSDDGGLSWLELNVFRGGAPKGVLLAADPFVSGRLYLGDACTDQPCVKISEDRGVSWHEVPMTIPAPWAGWIGEVVSVAPHPNIPGRILAGAGFCEKTADCNTGEEPAGIYASDNYGESWTYLGPTPAIKEVRMFAFDIADSNLIYAGTRGLGLWRSIDGGDSWAEVAIPGVLPPAHIVDILTHPDQPNTVYVRLYSYATTTNPQPNLFVSHNAGVTWQELPDTDTLTGGIGGFGLVIMPPAPNAGPYSIYAGCELGLCRTWESPWNWEALAGTPRPFTNISLVTASDEQRSRLYIGTPGGVLTPNTKSSLAAEFPGLGQLLNGGVYRQTTVLPKYWVYLTLVTNGNKP